MITSSEFRATVQDFIERSASDELPRPGESMLIGHRPDGAWKRLRIRRRLFIVPQLVVRGFILQFKVDRLAIVVTGEASREFRVVFMEKDRIDEAVSDARLAKLVKVARREWTHPSDAGRPPRRWFGRPYPIVLLVGVLGSEVLFDVLRVPWLIAGRYTWLPALPDVAAGILFTAYVAFVMVTIVMLWRQSPAAYGTTLALSAVQVLHSFAYYVPLIQWYGPGRVAGWILETMIYPAAIWALLLLQWSEERHAAR